MARAGMANPYPAGKMPFKFHRMAAFLRLKFSSCVCIFVAIECGTSISADFVQALSAGKMKPGQLQAACERLGFRV